MSTRATNVQQLGNSQRSTSQRRTKMPGHQKVVDHVVKLLQSGKVKPNSPLPSERQLAAEFGLSHMTVRKGLAVLVDQNLIERRTGIGTFAVDPRQPATPSETTAPASPASTRTGQAVALCMTDNTSEMPMLGPLVNGVRSILEPQRLPLEIVGFPDGGCNDQFWSLIGDRVQGLIVQGYLSLADIEALEARQMKFVSVGMELGRADAPWVSIDFEHMLTTIIKETYRFGHTSVGLVGWGPKKVPRSPTSNNHPSQQAYRRACYRFNMQTSANRMYQLPLVDWPDASLVDTRIVLDDLANLPTCLIVSDEVMAVALIRDLESKGMRVPEDISMVCLFDSTPHTHRLPMTGVDSKAEYMSIFRKATQMLLAQIQGKPLAATKINHQCTVHFKASLAPARVGAR